MSQFHTLRHAITDGAPSELFDLGEYIVRVLSVRVQSLDDVRTISGNDMAKIVYDWAKESSEG